MPQEKQSFILYCDARQHIGMMTNDQAGQLFRLLLDFAADGTAPTPEEIGDGLVAMAFSFLSAQIARDMKKYRETCEKRREAGRVGGRISAAKRAEAKAGAEQPNQTQANQAEHEPVPEPESEPDPPPDPGAAAAPAAGQPGDGMTKRTPEFFPGERTGATSMTGPDTPEALWARLGLGEGALPALAQLLAESRAKGMEEGVLAEAIRRTAEHQPKMPLAYLRSSLEQCAAKGCKTLAQFQAAHSGSGRGLRVDRAAPSGRDFLADAATRPLRRKRRDADPGGGV